MFNEAWYDFLTISFFVSRIGLLASEIYSEINHFILIFRRGMIFFEIQKYLYLFIKSLLCIYIVWFYTFRCQLYGSAGILKVRSLQHRNGMGSIPVIGPFYFSRKQLAFSLLSIQQSTAVSNLSIESTISWIPFIKKHQSYTYLLIASNFIGC